MQTLNERSHGRRDVQDAVCAGVDVGPTEQHGLAASRSPPSAVDLPADRGG